MKKIEQDKAILAGLALRRKSKPQKPTFASRFHAREAEDSEEEEVLHLTKLTNLMNNHQR